MTLADRVRAAAIDCGFDAAGICDLRPVERTMLDRWIAAGCGATMTYVHRQAKKRREPQRIVPEAKRAVVVLKNYFRRPRDPGAASVAQYAWGEDYHRVVGDQLKRLAGVLVDLGSTPDATRCFVDSGPVPERELAQRAGLGWIGKNTMLIRPDLGSFTFIGSVFTDLELEVDPPFVADHCGSCTACLDACPTGAFLEPGLLDARRCISYLTIEYHGAFDDEQGRMIGDWLFGCDVCQDVCPWNVRFAPPTSEPRFAERPVISRPDPGRLAELGETELAEAYAGTALERTGVSGLRRNARAVGANRDRRLAAD